jgi:hypothetical protein
MIFGKVLATLREPPKWLPEAAFNPVSMEEWKTREKLSKRRRGKVSPPHAAE